MELVLRDNDHKNGWEDIGNTEIADCIDQELHELREAIVSGNIECIRHECCDIANFAMMLHDNLTPRILTAERTDDHDDDHCMFHKRS